LPLFYEPIAVALGEATAQTMMDGMRIYYNFIRPHMALNGKTPAQKANIESDEARWMALIKKASRHQRFETKEIDT
jgi:hypothetical protein